MKDFLESLERGKQGERLVSLAFMNMGYLVIDKTMDKEYWEKDIDLIIFDKDGTKHLFEVKSDWNMAYTGNVVLELTNKSGDTCGWFNKTQSTHLAFCDMQNRIAYICRTKELRQWVQQHRDLKHYIIQGCDCVLINITDTPIFRRLCI